MDNHEFEFDIELNDLAIRLMELDRTIKYFTENTTLNSDIRTIIVDNIQEEISDLVEQLNEFKTN